MKIDTLKKLIEDEYHKTSDMEQFKESVMEFIDLFEKDNLIVQPFSFDDQFEEIFYHQICSCNPINGGNGNCGCTTPNLKIRKQKHINNYNINYQNESERNSRNYQAI